MRLVRFGPKGAEKPGCLDDAGRVRDLSAAVNDIAGAVLTPEGLAPLKLLDPENLPLAPEGVRLGTPLAGIGKVVCIALNYSDHAAEMASELPKEPKIFMKALSAVNGPYDVVPIPRTSTEMDYEAELAVIIGKPAKYVSEADALSHVAGYAIINDVSERVFQKQRGGEMTKGKSGDGFAPIGPWLVTADEIADPQALDLLTLVDGEQRQKGNSSSMIFGVAKIISYLSEFFTLNTGDVIATGTPHGVAAGMKPPRFVQSGQVVTIRIKGLGEQRVTYIRDK
jgi:2-keto-4-pentenoate hydratase/2-oxohepta-3-ene-1,7-dioic acid hydratase in catechol pathway